MRDSSLLYVPRFEGIDVLFGMNYLAPWKTTRSLRGARCFKGHNSGEHYVVQCAGHTRNWDTAESSFERGSQYLETVGR